MRERERERGGGGGTSGSNWRNLEGLAGEEKNWAKSSGQFLSLGRYFLHIFWRNIFSKRYSSCVTRWNNSIANNKSLNSNLNNNNNNSKKIGKKRNRPNYFFCGPFFSNKSISISFFHKQEQKRIRNITTIPVSPGCLIANFSSSNPLSEHSCWSTLPTLVFGVTRKTWSWLRGRRHWKE